MAQSKSFFGLRRGSAGNMTFSVAKGSKGEKIQVTKFKPESVANPNTDGQILQRMKARPAHLCYAALSEILDHSFEGVAYGEMSRRHALSLMMKADGPYIPKGIDRFVPFSAQVSEGTLPSLGTAIANSGQQRSNSYERPVVVTTSGIKWNQIVNLYGEKIQLTGIAVTVNASGVYEVIIDRLVVTENIATLMASNAVAGNAGLLVFMFEDAGNIICYPGTISDGTDSYTGTPVAGVIIVSKEDASGKWLRSTEVMAINASLKVSLYGSDALAAALASFKTNDTANGLGSDWYLNLANLQAFNGQIQQYDFFDAATIGGKKFDEAQFTMATFRRYGENGGIQEGIFTTDGTEAGYPIVWAGGEWKGLNAIDATNAVTVAQLKADSQAIPSNMYRNLMKWSELYGAQFTPSNAQGVILHIDESGD